MVSEIPKEESLFPEKEIAKDIQNYQYATNKAREGGVGVFEVKREMDGEVTAVKVFVCDKDGDLLEISFEPSIEGRPAQIINYSFLGIIDQEKAIGFNLKMIKKEVLAEMEKIVAGIFAKKTGT